ncbi:MAG: hypothetical protein OQK77_02325 [Psychromonas sp.]|nr:hypothetical protein [Psychromonas sp.]
MAFKKVVGKADLELFIAHLQENYRDSDGITIDEIIKLITALQYILDVGWVYLIKSTH